MSNAAKKLRDQNFVQSPLLSLVSSVPVGFEAPPVSSMEGLRLLGTSLDYRQRRKWLALDQRTFQHVSGNSKMLRDLIHESLKKVFRDLREAGRISIVSFGVDSPILESSPDRFVILSSSDQKSEGILSQSFLAHGYPEMLEAFRLRQAVIVPDVRLAPSLKNFLKRIEKTGARSVAAIPLLIGSKTFGVIKARLPQVDDPQTQELLSDLSSYSMELAPFVAQYDFFTRLYRNMPR